MWLRAAIRAFHTTYLRYKFNHIITFVTHYYRVVIDHIK